MHFRILIVKSLCIYNRQTKNIKAEEWTQTGLTNVIGWNKDLWLLRCVVAYNIWVIIVHLLCYEHYLSRIYSISRGNWKQLTLKWTYNSNNNVFSANNDEDSAMNNAYYAYACWKIITKLYKYCTQSKCLLNQFLWYRKDPDYSVKISR